MASSIDVPLIKISEADEELGGRFQFINPHEASGEEVGWEEDPEALKRQTSAHDDSPIVQGTVEGGEWITLSHSLPISSGWTMLPILTENNPLISTMKEQVGDRVDHNLFEPPELPANPPPSPPSSITTEYGSDSRETAPAPAQGPPATPYVTRRPSAGEVSHQQALRRAQLEFSASAGPQHFPRIFSSSSSSSGGSSKNAPPSPTPPPLYPPAPPSPRGIYPVYACRSPSPSSPPSSSSSSSSSSAIPCIGSVRGSRRGESRVGAGGGGSSTCQPPPPPPPPLRFYDRMTLPPEIHHQPIAPARREQQQQQPAPHHHHLPSPSYRAQYAAELERLGALRLAQQAQAYERQKHHHHHQNQNQNQLLFADRVPEHSRGLDPLDRFVPGVVGFRD